MIRKFLISVTVFLLIFSFAYSQDYKSNILGQKLGIADNDSEYVLSENNGVSLLKQNGETIKKISFENTEGIQIVNEEDFRTGNKYVRKYSNGLLIDKIETTSSGSTEYKFNYVDGSLIFCTIIKDDKEPVTEYYLKDSYEGRLIGTNVFSAFNLSGNGYLIENDTLFRQLTDSVVVNDSFEFDNEGNIIYQKNNNEYKYSSEGLIINQNNQGIITEYKYDDNNNIIQTETVNGNQRLLKTYQDGKIEKEFEYENEELKSVIDRTDSSYGFIKKIYKSGNEIADVYYDFDGIKILKIDYLN